MWLVLPAFAANELPEVELSWRRDRATLKVSAPAGHHLALEAPFTAQIELDGQSFTVEGQGSLLHAGLPLALGEEDQHTLSADLRVSVCTDDGSTCVPADVSVLGTFDGRRGARVLPSLPPAPPMGAPEAPDEAFQAAAASGKLVLIDFSATWCPPCNLLAAEVLHDPANAADLAAYELLVVDVDRRESWEIKDRYAVGGYPTVVLARADGTELARLVGYPGEAAFLTFVQGVAQGGAPPEVDRRIAAASTPEDVDWLLKEAPERVGEWFWAVKDLPLTPAQSAEIQAAAVRQLAVARGVQAADLLETLAEMSPPEGRPALYATAAVALESSFTGDPALDRGHWVRLADLQEGAGRADLAESTLRQGIAAYPAEFTFHHALAGLLTRQGRHAEALSEAEAAQKLAYGDMVLRAVKRRSEILVALGRPEEAKAVVDAALAAAERPAEGVDVRTNRYLKELETFRATLP